MIQGDWDRFVRAFSMLAVTFERELTEPLRDAYWAALKDLSIDGVEAAIADTIQNGTKFPQPGELREKLGGSTKERAIEAWSDVERSMPLGSYRHVNFEDTYINATIRSLGGWPAMFEHCATTESENFYRLRFIQTYETMASRKVSGEVCRPLAGLSQAEVRGEQIVEPIPRLVRTSESRKRLCSPPTKPIKRLYGKTTKPSEPKHAGELVNPTP